jgi:colanic acid/amylovoran biosynthesis glycosyltransferase
VWRERYRQLFAKAALVLCEGRHGANEIIKLGCPGEKVSIQHLGIDTAAIARTARMKKSGELQLVQIANFREKKGHIYTAQAFRQALADCPNMTLTFVGRDTENLRRGVGDALGEATSHVQFLDTVDFHKLHDFLADFHVFIHPSISAANGDCEGGAPVVLLDAQATGMPVIATRHCDIPEEVRDGETGLLADEKDVAGLAAAIRRFYTMEQREYDEFCTRAVAHVTAEYDAARNAAVLRQRYDALFCHGPSYGGYTRLAKMGKHP